MVGVGWPLYDGLVLRRLRIENLVLIREAELEFAPGLNAISGETGAGKTILAQAIGLLLGAKGDASFLGTACEEAYVEAELDVLDRFAGDDQLRVRRELRIAWRALQDVRRRHKELLAQAGDREARLAELCAL